MRGRVFRVNSRMLVQVQVQENGEIRIVGSGTEIEMSTCTPTRRAPNKTCYYSSSIQILIITPGNLILMTMFPLLPLPARFPNLAVSANVETREDVRLGIQNDLLEVVPI